MYIKVTFDAGGWVGRSGCWSTVHLFTRCHGTFPDYPDVLAPWQAKMRVSTAI